MSKDEGAGRKPCPDCRGVGYHDEVCQYHPALGGRGMGGGAAKVYVVMNGERCEGGSVMSVHLSEDTARDAALKVKAHFAGGWQETNLNTWENGCDFVAVVEMELLP